METVVDIDPTIESLYEVVSWDLNEWIKFSPGDMKVTPYCYDDRTGWDTYIVTINGWGVCGFTDGNIFEKDQQ